MAPAAPISTCPIWWPCAAPFTSLLALQLQPHGHRRGSSLRAVHVGLRLGTGAKLRPPLMCHVGHQDVHVDHQDGCHWMTGAIVSPYACAMSLQHGNVFEVFAALMQHGNAALVRVFYPCACPISPMCLRRRLHGLVNVLTETTPLLSTAARPRPRCSRPVCWGSASTATA